MQSLVRTQLRCFRLLQSVHGSGPYVAPSVSRSVSSVAGTGGRRLHQPLGSVPSGVDYQQVRDKWGSDAMEKIQDVDVIEVDGPVAVCDGGGGALGHPVEYIKLNVSDEGLGYQVCKYCGLKYRRKRH